MKFTQKNINILSPSVLEDWSLSSKVINISVLDKDRNIYRKASGFIINNNRNLFLYTCWHVVTGYDFFEPKIKDPPIPRYLKISGYDVSKSPEFLNNTRKNIQTNTGEIITIGDCKEFTFPLYSEENKPLWEQAKGCERVNLDLETIGIKIPHSIDVIRLAITIPKEISALWALDKRHLEYKYNPKMWDKVYIMGFPHGYSATSEKSPTPISLKRMIASWTTDSTEKTLLDGAGVPGMSGGPVFSQKKKLIGIYRGIIYPDYNPRVTCKNNDRHSALGIITGYYMIGLVFGDLYIDSACVFHFRGELKP